jgi:hypothetical protein
MIVKQRGGGHHCYYKTRLVPSIERFITILGSSLLVSENYLDRIYI